MAPHPHLSRRAKSTGSGRPRHAFSPRASLEREILGGKSQQLQLSTTTAQTILFGEHPRNNRPPPSKSFPSLSFWKPITRNSQLGLDTKPNKSQRKQLLAFALLLHPSHVCCFLRIPSSSLTKANLPDALLFLRRRTALAAMTGRWKPPWLQKLIKRTSTLGSEKRKTCLSTDRLTNHTDQLARSPRRHLLKSCLLDSDSTTTSPSIEEEQPAMADGEEDFSSLPLTDRWVHKVRASPYSLTTY